MEVAHPASHHLPASIQSPKDVPPQSATAYLSHRASITTKATGTLTPVSPDDIQMQRMIFIKQFQETIQKSKHIPFDASHQEAINKYLCDNRPSQHHHNRDQHSDSASTISNQQPQQLTSPMVLRKPPIATPNSPKKRQSKKLSRKKSDPHSLLKESFKNKRSHEGPLTPPANSCKDYGYSYNRKEIRDETASQSELSSIGPEDYDSDYWEEDRLLLKWEAKRLGLSYLGIEELAKHTEEMKLSEEQRLHLLMK